MNRDRLEYARILEQNGIEVPEGTIIDLRYVTCDECWYARTEESGWVWWDARHDKQTKSTWMPCPMGPL